MKKSTPPSRPRLSAVILALLCFVFSPITDAKQPKPPDGDLGNGNTAEGGGALFSLTTGASNTAMGFDALYKNTTGFDNTANGYQALYSNTTGFANTATGLDALLGNTTGTDNTATGHSALYSNTTGAYNTGSGVAALGHNTSGIYNTATGYFALFANTTGLGNTAHGGGALTQNTTGNANTATGFNALDTNTTGDYNTADGDIALSQNQTGIQNTAVGFDALSANVSGSYNIALGVGAGKNITAFNNIDIGNLGVASDSNTIRIGNTAHQPSPHTATFIGGIRGAMTGNSDAIPVVIDSAGQLGTVSSSARFKNEIKPMEKNSEAIFELQPVTFHYKSDKKGKAQFGLIAEQVAAVNPNLVVCDANGEIYTVRYDAVNAMLLNEFIKEHRAVQDLKSIVAEQQKQIQTLTAGLQKVNALIELTRSPQVADINK